MSLVRSRNGWAGGALLIKLYIMLVHVNRDSRVLTVIHDICFEVAWVHFILIGSWTFCNQLSRLWLSTCVSGEFDTTRRKSLYRLILCSTNSVLSVNLDTYIQIILTVVKTCTLLAHFFLLMYRFLIHSLVHSIPWKHNKFWTH